MTFKRIAMRLLTFSCNQVLFDEFFVSFGCATCLGLELGCACPMVFHCHQWVLRYLCRSAVLLRVVVASVQPKCLSSFHLWWLAAPHHQEILCVCDYKHEWHEAVYRQPSLFYQGQSYPLHEAEPIFEFHCKLQLCEYYLMQWLLSQPKKPLLVKSNSTTSRTSVSLTIQLFKRIKTEEMKWFFEEMDSLLDSPPDSYEMNLLVMFSNVNHMKDWLKDSTNISAIALPNGAGRFCLNFPCSIAYLYSNKVQFENNFPSYFRQRKKRTSKDSWKKLHPTRPCIIFQQTNETINGDILLLTIFRFINSKKNKINIEMSKKLYETEIGCGKCQNNGINA